MAEMTNVEVARRLGLSPSQVSRMRSGGRGPSIETLQKISTEFDVPLEELTKAVLKAQNGNTKTWVALLRRIFRESVAA